MSGGSDHGNANFDQFLFELLLQDQPLVSLLRAARAMDQLEFLHGATGQRR